MAHICSSCGFEASDKFKFCPMCGSKMTSDDESAQEKYKFCPKCGIKISADTQICPNCGINFNGIFRKIANKYFNNGSIDKIIDWEASTSWKINKDFTSNKLIKKGWEHDDPAFLVVYDSIVGDYLKKLFILERSKVCVGGSTDILVNVKFIPPTEKMSFDDAVKFYEELLEKTILELNEAKQKENFDEEEYFKKKYKESRIELFSNYPL